MESQGKFAYVGNLCNVYVLGLGHSALFYSQTFVRHNIGGVQCAV